jgi:hypothetical protein
LPICPRIDVEKVAKVPAEVREEVNDDSFKEVHDTDDTATTIHKGLTKHRRVPKPNSRYSPEDYDLNYVRGTQRNKSRPSPRCSTMPRSGRWGA